MCPFHKSTLLALAVLLAGIACADDSVKDLSQDAAKRGKEFKPIPTVPVTEDDRRHAEELGKAAVERGQQALLDWQAQQSLPDNPGHWAPLAEAERLRSQQGKGKAPELAGRLIVALSSSMPMTMVHDYMAQLAGIPEVVVVLRGFVGGGHTVAPTGKWLEEARRATPGCVRCEHYNVQTLVDPLIYRDLKIEQVPAMAWAPGVTDISHCDGKTLKNVRVLYGATSVEASVKALVADGSSLPATLINKVRSKGWESKRHPSGS